jgi:CheY-like chemotaxis protein
MPAPPPASKAAQCAFPGAGSFDTLTSGLPHRFVKDRRIGGLMGEARDGSVLVVDDEALVAMLLTDMLEDMGLRVCDTAATAQEAIALAETHRPDVVLMDIRLQGAGDGIDAAVEIHRRQKTPIIFLTGSRDQETLERIQRHHPADVLTKPIVSAQLKAAIDKVLA